MRLGRRAFAAVHECSNETKRSWTARMAEPSGDRTELVNRAVTIVNQLFHDRCMVLHRQERGEIEREARRAGDDNAVATSTEVGWPDGCRLVEGDARNRVEMHSMWHNELDRLHP